jgi:hypothetical protein
MSAGPFQTMDDIQKKEKLRLYMRDYRKRMKESKRCIACGIPVTDGRTMCPDHREKTRQRNRRSNRLRRLDASPFVGELATQLELRRQLTNKFNELMDTLVGEISECDTRIAMMIDTHNSHLVSMRDKLKVEQG